MNPLSIRRTKIVATLGPASESPEMIRKLLAAGMDVARINFSHGSHERHGAVIASVREIARELGRPITILQDLQGPKIRVSRLAGDRIVLAAGESVDVVPDDDYTGQASTIPIDYPSVAEEAKPGMRVLLADGLFELEVVAVSGRRLNCRVIDGGVLTPRKGVNFPSLNLHLPSLTAKDEADVVFGIELGVDWFSLSFVRSAVDVTALKDFLRQRNCFAPVMAKIEKPQALEHIDEIVEAADGIMVARGDLGVEMNPEKVPMAQKRLIEKANRKGIPVITATQMLESMVHEPRPTRAEASDVANAIVDGTDAVMLSAESAIGDYPVKAVEMMARIAREVESQIAFKTYPLEHGGDVRSLCEAGNLLARLVEAQCIAVLTTSGCTARGIAAERPKALVVALTGDERVYHSLNLFWGLRPVLVPKPAGNFEELIQIAEKSAVERGFAKSGGKMLVIGGVPAGQPRGSNFLKIHEIGPAET